MINACEMDCELIEVTVIGLARGPAVCHVAATMTRIFTVLFAVWIELEKAVA